MSWLFVRQGQVHWDGLIAHISPFNPVLPPYIAAQGLNPQSPVTVVAMAQEIGRQAQMLAFVDLFWFIGLVTLAILPLVLLMQRPKTTALLIPAHA